MALVKVRSKAQITLPAEVRNELGIDEGDLLEARVEGNKIILEPQIVVPKFPEVELSEAGERMLDEALEDEAARRVREYESVDALIADLDDEAPSH